MPRAAAQPDRPRDRGAAKRAAAETPNAVRVEAAPGDSFANLLWIQVEPDPLNPRKHFDPDAIEELAASIAQDGLLENLVVRAGVVPDEPIVILDGAHAPMHRLVAGERRWRAIGRLIETGRWPRERPIPCKVVEIDDAAHRRLALVENLQRRDLRPLEEARAIRELMAATGAGTADVAAEIGFTQRWVQQRLQLLELPEGKAAALDRGQITIEDARRWLASRPQVMDLTDRQWLLLAELARKACDDNDYVPGAAQADPDLEVLAGPYLVHGPYPEFECGYETGRFRCSMGLAGDQQLGLKFNVDPDDAAALELLIAQLQAGLGVSPPPGVLYATEWLRGRLEIAAEIAEKIAQARADRERQAAEQREAEAAQRRAEGEAFNRAHSMVIQGRKRAHPALDARFAEACEAIGWRLPVHVADNGDVVDAAGVTVNRTGYWGPQLPARIRAKHTLLALAINAAAGLATPDAPSDDAAAAADPPPQGEVSPQATEGGSAQAPDDGGPAPDIPPYLRRLAGAAPPEEDAA